MKNLLYNYRYILIVITATMISLLVLFGNLMSGEYLFLGGDSLSSKTIKHAVNEEIKINDDYPDWLPWIFSGLPSTHSMQNVSNYYFPNHLMLAMNSIGLPWFWNYIFHYLFCCIGLYLLLRQLKLSFIPSLFGCLSFSLTPYMTTMVVHGHGSQMMTAAYIPWVILFLFRLKDNLSISNVLFFGILLGLQLQRGHVQIAYYTWMMIGAFLIFDIFSRGYKSIIIKNKWFYIYMLSSLIIAIGLSAWLYLPLLNYSSLSIRTITSSPDSFIYSTMWSLNPRELITFFFPGSYGFGGTTYWGHMPFTDYPNYIGLYVFILSLVGIFFSKNYYKNLFSFILIFSIIIAFGKFFPIYKFLYYYLPFFEKFRVPSMILIISQFCFSILAAMGIQSFFENSLNKRKKGIFKFTIFSIFSILGTSYLFYYLIDFGDKAHPILDEFRFKIINEDLIIITILTVFFILGLYIIKHKKDNLNIIMSFLVFIGVCDLLKINNQIINPNEEFYNSPILKHEKYLKNYFTEDEVIKYLKKDSEKFRVLALDKHLFSDNRLAAFHIEKIGGYHPAKLSLYDNYLNKVDFSDIGVLKQLNVKYLLSSQKFEHPFFSMVFSGDYYSNFKKTHTYIYEFKDFSSRVNFVNQISKIDNIKLNNFKFVDNEFDPKNIAYISNEENYDIDIIHSNDSKIEILKWNPNIISIQTDVPVNEKNKKEFLVLSEIFYNKGWKLTSHPDQKIIKTNGISRGFFVESGLGTYTMEFIPNDMLYGYYITIMTSLLIVIIFFFIYLRGYTFEK